MILVDTSVWIDHFRNKNDHLVFLLNEGKVFCHPLIVGELACGNLKNRNKILTLLQNLPEALHVNHKEILLFIDTNKLMGKGLGYIDVHLLASTKLTDLYLWTFDKQLNSIALYFNINYKYE